MERKPSTTRAPPPPSPRLSTVALSPQEIQRKLDALSTSATAVPLSSDSTAIPEIERRRSSTASNNPGFGVGLNRKTSTSGASVSGGGTGGSGGGGGMSSTDDEDYTLSPVLQASTSTTPGGLPLCAISESGSDSDASSINDNQGRLVGRAVEKLREETFEAAVMSGYLMKKGERRKAWKKRWFVLRGGRLAMYKNDKEYQLLRLIPLSEIHSCTPILLKKHTNAFGLVTPKRTYYIKASSPTEQLSWCSAIERAKSDLKAAATVSSIDSPTPEPGTPHAGGGGDLTPIASRAQTITRGVRGLSISGGSTLSPTPLSPRSATAQLSSSVSSTTSSFLPPPVQLPRVPPNSYSTSGMMERPSTSSDTPLGPYAQEGVDMGKVDSSLLMSGGYFSSASVRSTGTLPVSPGLSSGGGGGGVAMSSSEDEYDDDEPVAPLGGGGGLRFDTTSPAAARSPPVTSSGGFGDPNKVVLSGYLMKQGKRKNWRKRWFVLMSGKLCYSRSHMDSRISRQIPLSSILDAIELPFSSPQQNTPHPHQQQSHESITTEHSFKIITPKRTYVVCAPTEEDEIKWLAALQVCLGKRKENESGAVAAGGSGGGGSSVRQAIHGRERSVTDAARDAVREGVETYRAREGGRARGS